MKQLSIFIILIVLIGSLLGTEAITGQQRIELTKDLDNSTSMSVLESQAVRDARYRAVFRKAVQILPFSLTDKRKEILGSYLDGKSEDFVLTYALDMRDMGSKSVEFIFYVSVNEKALKQRLKNLGTYFTTKYKVQYSLQTSGISSDIWQDILRLENLSGLKRGDVQSPLLRLQYDKDNERWSGIIQTTDKYRSEKALTLSALWEKIWSFYFMLPETQARFLETLFVRVKWWTTSTGLQTFNENLNSWTSVLDEFTLKHLKMTPKGIQGQWKMKTMNINGLKQHLEGFLNNRGVSLSYSTDPFK